MPAALSVNWEALKAAYLQGVPLSEIARQHGVSHSALRARAHRYKWRAIAAQGAAMLQQSVTLSMHERGQLWGHRIATLMERRLDYLEGLDPSKLKLPELEALSRVTEMTDKVARRTFGLDSEAPRTNLTVNMASLPKVGGAFSPIIEIEAVPQPVAAVDAPSGGA